MCLLDGATCWAEGAGAGRVAGQNIETSVLFGGAADDGLSLPPSLHPPNPRITHGGVLPGTWLEPRLATDPETARSELEALARL